MPRAFFKGVAALVASAAFSLTLSAHAGEGTAQPALPMPAPSPLSPPPWLGVQMNAGGDIGVTVERVVRGSPAEKAGVRAGDRILALDGAKVAVPAQVTRTVGQHKVGETIAVEIERRGTPTIASVVLAPRPSGDDMLRMNLVGVAAPEWSVTAIAGAPSSVAQLRGRVVLLDFWASWCGPCRMLAPRLNALKDKFGAQGLSVVGLTTDEAEKAAVFAEKNQMRYGIVIDKDAETSRAYGVSALPTMLLIDKKGVVREVFVGFDPSGEARVEAVLKTLLAESAPPAGPLPPPTPNAPRPAGR